ncbi:MAG: TerB family tellurite resistance protein [Pseudolabrys sp.]|jgi:tellurite resistance protein
MMEKHRHPKPATAELLAAYFEKRDDEVMQALAAAGALVALADGRLEAAEREELVDFIDRQGFVPTASRAEIAAAFDRHARELAKQISANAVMEAFRPLAGRSLASIIVRTAERVAAADRKIHAGELRALKLIRLVMMTLPARRPLPA